MITRLTIIILLVAINFSLAQTNHYNAGSSRVEKKSEKQLPNIIMLEGSYLRNLGEFGQVYKQAGGLFLNYGAHFFKNSHVIFKTGYTDYKVRNESTKDSTSFKTIPVQIGIRYYLLTNSVMPYFSLVNGVNVISQDKDINGNNDSKTLCRYMWQVGFGVAVNVAKPLNIDLSAKYNNNFYNPDAMMTSFEYSAGLSYNIGK